MPAPFHHLTLAEFAELLRRFPFTRRINAVHMHHTWRPNHSQYQGEETIAGMWRYQTQVNHWSDIAQHITIAPDGTIWTGRNWNLAPASAAGNNGNATAGPFMFEMIGDFDHGRDRLEGKQRETALRVITLVQKQFNLTPETLRFHNQMSPKSCPGTAIDYNAVLSEVRRLHAAPRDAEVAPEARDPDSRPFGDDALAIHETVAAFSRALPEGSDPPDAEPVEEEMRPEELQRFFNIGSTPDSRGAAGDASRESPRAPALTPEMLSELRPHVIDLRQGEFSSEGRFSTERGDVDAIFDERLVRELDAARARKEKLRLLFFAHGGLVSESNGLWIAYKHISWWQRNHVYPIYFVWETGFIETIMQLLTRSRQRTQRAVARDVWDYTTDPLIETAARALYGPRLWGGMKRSAELASADGGGAHYVAEKLKAFCDTHPGEVELHAAGHSAGAIFHAHFIPTALEMRTPPFRSVQFLAPAIRVDTFQELLAKRLGAGIERLNLFTMRKDLEQADNCGEVYHKSLLYLIHYALEPERKEPILGLEASLRADPALRKLFGLEGPAGAAGEVIWSTTSASSGRSASRSTSHGGFDDDAATMESVARRVLGVDDDKRIVEFPRPTAEERGLDEWQDQVDWPEEIEFLSLGSKQSWSLEPPRPAVLHPTVPTPPPAPSAGSLPSIPVGLPGGRRRVLCVGINRYPTAPLNGCVADAESWAETLVQLGFGAPILLRDEKATRSAILDALTEMVTASSAGDVLVFQYAGHGTTLPDVSGDEASGPLPNQDEAICPYDFDEGHFLIDDDIAEVFGRIPAGVNVTCFIDCCHSGTISRFAVGTAARARAAGQDPHARFLPASSEMIAAHRRFRERTGRRRLLTARGPDTMREVVFSACLASEVAWESGGHGDFTVQATQLLRAGADGVTNEEFQRRVTAAFGAMPRQHPDLDCAPGANARALLQPLAGLTATTPGAGRGLTADNGLVADTATLAQGLRAMAALLERR